MLVLDYTRISQTSTARVENGHIVEEEGMALVKVMDGGEVAVRKSTGAADEIFAGVSLSRNAPTNMLPYVAETAVPTAETMKLARTPIAGQILVKVDGTALTVSANAPADATEVQLAGDTLTFFAGEADKEVYVQFMYEPTVTEARQETGDMPIGGLPSSSVGSIGMVVSGCITTNQYDASVDWAAGELTPSLGVDGKFTVGGSGTKLDNLVTVDRIPSAANPYLSLTIRA